MKKDIDARKVVGTVIGIVIFISCAFYFTYAWYQWKSGNSTVDLTIKDGSVECSSGPSVDVKNIGPVLNISDGVKTSFSVKNTGSVDATLGLVLGISSISDSLKTESFKYALYQDTTGSNQFDYTATPLLTGNFSEMKIGKNILSRDLTIAKNSTSSFQFVVYIDGNMPNDSSMMNSSLTSQILYGNCDTLTRYLSNAEPGAYVKYTGNNGCSGKACEGQNANYVSDEGMGYCYDSSYKFNANGWRVAYVEDGSAYLTSAGSPECMCTNSDGTSSGTSCSSNETTVGVPKHLANLNTKALTYCNSSYAYEGKCDSNSAWNMNDIDFQNITGDTLNAAFEKTDNGDNSYDDYSLVNNGGFYWFATPYSASSTYVFGWFPRTRRVIYGASRDAFGVRPVLKLAPTIKITGGSGTYADPYTIDNTKLSDVEPGSYVKYTGNNGCSGKACEGQNANYVSDTNMGYCINNSYKFNVNGWRVAYVKNGSAYLTSAGAPECMCTNSSGVAGTSCSDSETTGGVPKHRTNLNTKALTYCNSSYAYGGKCDSSSAWNMNDTDFQNITGDTLNVAYDENSGFYDSYSLINNGGFYWFATAYSASSTSAFYWVPDDRYVGNDSSAGAYGVRPVLRLASSVKVTGGSGTYEDPYTISNSG